MPRVLRRWLVTSVLLLITVSLHAQASQPTQSTEEAARAQEDFAIATATAHARTSLFGIGSKPFSIHASVWSGLALHGIGQGTYDNEWVDNQHWRRTIRFPDFHQAEMRNDGGHSWTDGSQGAMPIRVVELLRVVVLHVPGSNTASRVPVAESSITDGSGAPLTCYTVTAPKLFQGLTLQYRWCFDKDTGLVVSQDMPLNTHISYSNYILFQGKHEFTHVRVTSGALPVLELDLHYTSLDPHALDGAVPEAFMHRSEDARPTPNPEDMQKGSVRYRYNPILPPGTPETAKNAPVMMHFYVGADTSLLDAAIESASTVALAEAALQAASHFTFTPLVVDGARVNNHFLQSVWFRSPTQGASPAAALDGTFRGEQPPFVFHFPADFETLPQGEIEEDLRTTAPPNFPGVTPGETCTTILFRAQRLHPNRQGVDYLTMYDLSPNCEFGLLDHKALETIASNAAGTILKQWARGSIAQPQSYVINGRRTFGAVFFSGQATTGESLKAIVATTNVRGHVLIWSLVGTGDDIQQTLASCTLQAGDEAASPLPTVSLNP